MPAHAAAAKRYAQAVFQLALEAGQLEVWERDLAQAVALASDAQVSVLLERLRPAPEQRLLALRRALPGLSPLSMNLVQVLIVKGRLGLLPGIVAEYQELLDAHNGIQHASVTSAVPLEPGLQENLARALTQRTGKTIVLDTKVDPKVVSGLVIRVGDQIIDGSARTKLEGLRRALEGRSA